MNIGFDAKRIFHNSTGLGNYGRDAIRILHRYTPIDKFILYNTATSNVDRLDILQRIYIKYPKGWFWKKFSSLWCLGPVSKQIINDKVDIFHGLTGELPAGLEKNGYCDGSHDSRFDISDPSEILLLFRSYDLRKKI